MEFNKNLRGARIILSWLQRSSICSTQCGDCFAGVAEVVVGQLLVLVMVQEALREVTERARGLDDHEATECAWTRNLPQS